jgi:lipopolysaccharide biosynthesis glycosyltransferase
MKLDFLYCFDENFNKQAFTSIFSLLEEISIRPSIHIIHNKVETIEPYTKILIENPKLESLSVYEFDAGNIKLPPIKSHISEATYYRLFVSEYLSSKIENLVYLDADIICINDPYPAISNVFHNMYKENTLLAAKTELKREKNNLIFEKLGLIGDDYFNAGVLFINYQKWLDNDIQEKLLNLISERFDIIQDYDQEVMNIYFDNNYTKIKMELNFQATTADTELMREIQEEVYFLHYLGKTKPWYVEGVVNPVSVFYQDVYKKIGLGKYHLIFNKDKSTLKKYINIVVKLKFLKLKYPFYYLINTILKLLFK